MGSPTGYLFGDSTPSPLKTDFVAFLRDAFDFSVQVLLCDVRIAESAKRVERLSEVTEKEIERAEALASQVSRALDGVPIGDAESLAARCAMRIRQGAKDLVQAEADGVRAAVTTERMRASQAVAGDRDAVVKAFEGLALRHTLPDSESSIRVAIDDKGGYDAALRAETPYGLEWTMALEISDSHPLAQILRIDRVVERLDVDAPEEGGWIHKEVRIRPQRFDRLHLTELTREGGDTTIKLRVGPDGTGGGFDVRFRHGASSAQLVRVVEGGPSADSPYDVVGDDYSKLRSLHDSLFAMARDLGEHKKALRAASLDGASLVGFEVPRVIVERIIGNIAPTVREIAKRSLVPGELVLKRIVSDNHREEVFLSKRELEEKLAALPSALRSVFDPLGLWEANHERPAAPATLPLSHSLPQGPAAAPREQLAPAPTVIVASEPGAAASPASPVAQASAQPPRPSARPPRP